MNVNSSVEEKYVIFFVFNYLLIYSYMKTGKVQIIFVVVGK